MTRRGACALAAIATCLTTMGCTGKDSPAPTTPAPQTKTLEVSYDDLLNQKQVRRDVSLAVGDTLQLTLGSNASTGYQWAADARIGDSSVLTQTGHRTVAPTNAKPGASGTEVWTFSALKPGTTTVATSYGQPWPGGATDAWTFTADVTVS